MMTKKLTAFLSPKTKIRLEGGYSLRLLTAMEVLEAHREAQSLASDEKEHALLGNACLLARALERRGRPVFHDGDALLRAMQPHQIASLAARWQTFSQQENPSLSMGDKVVNTLKKAWSTRPTNA